MKSEHFADHKPMPLAADTRPYVGRLEQRQDNFGKILVVGRRGDEIEILSQTKKLFPRDGCVEVQGVLRAGLVNGDWAEFDIVRNTRPRAPAHKAVNLRRLPRYAVLPDSTLAGHRATLTESGWRGDKRSGLWALRISDDRVIVADLEQGDDGGLRIPRGATGKVQWCDYHDDSVARIETKNTRDDLFIGDHAASGGSFDWSSEVDHVAQVIRSLADADDPSVPELISWLELHHEEGTGRIGAADIDHDAAKFALRSGDLAKRLEADRELMEAYLDAAKRDEKVRASIERWTREAHGEEADRLHRELRVEIEREREGRLAQVAAQVQTKRREEFKKVEDELAKHATSLRADIDNQLCAAREARDKKIQALDADFDRRHAELKRQTAELLKEVEIAQIEADAARVRLNQLEMDENGAREELAAVRAEVDRLLAITGRLDQQGRESPAATWIARGGVGQMFHDRPLASVSKKGELIARQVLLTDHGKQLLMEVATLMLAGELPLLTGCDAVSLLKVAEALLCPGRSASIEADPTIISIDDLWSRPGSGAPTAIAAAAKAAESRGGVLVTIHGIERSGARFWHPALAEALRAGALPRDLLVACVVNDPKHEELAALPRNIHLMEIENALTTNAYLVGPALLSYPVVAEETVASEEGPTDLSVGSTLLAKMNLELPLDLSLRIARIYVQAIRMSGDEVMAETMINRVVRRMTDALGLQAL